MPERKYADYDVRIVQFPDSGEPDRVRFYHEKCLPDTWLIALDPPEGVFNGPDGNPVKCEKCGEELDFRSLNTLTPRGDEP